MFIICTTAANGAKRPGIFQAGGKRIRATWRTKIIFFVRGVILDFQCLISLFLSLLSPCFLFLMRWNLPCCKSPSIPFFRSLIYEARCKWLGQRLQRGGSFLPRYSWYNRPQKMEKIKNHTPNPTSWKLWAKEIPEFLFHRNQLLAEKSRNEKKMGKGSQFWQGKEND